MFGVYGIKLFRSYLYSNLLKSEGPRARQHVPVVRDLKNKQVNYRGQSIEGMLSM